MHTDMSVNMGQHVHDHGITKGIHEPCTQGIIDPCTLSCQKRGRLTPGLENIDSIDRHQPYEWI